MSAHRSLQLPHPRGRYLRGTRDVAAAHSSEVERLLAVYDAWLRDVSSTRQDNYAPPRIVIGSPHETVTVLTRQDWRHEADRPWAPYSNGSWRLRVRQRGHFELIARYPAVERVGSVRLELDDQPIDAQDAAPGAVETGFDLLLPVGDYDLRITVEAEGRLGGPHQVEVRRVTE